MFSFMCNMCMWSGQYTWCYECGGAESLENLFWLKMKVCNETRPSVISQIIQTLFLWIETHCYFSTVTTIIKDQWRLQTNKITLENTKSGWWTDADEKSLPSSHIHVKQESFWFRRWEIIIIMLDFHRLSLFIWTAYLTTKWIQIKLNDS